MEPELIKRLDSIDHKFDRIDGKFDKIDQRFDSIDQRFDSVDKKFDVVDQKLSVMDAKFDVVDQRLGAMDEKIGTMDEKMGDFDSTQNRVILKLIEIDEKLNTKVSHDEFQQLRNEMLTNFDEQTVILNRLDQERVFAHERTNRIEDDVGRVKKHLHLS